MISSLTTASENFAEQFAELIRVPESSAAEVKSQVEDILARVKIEGDAAVLELTNRFDQVSAENMADLEISQSEMAAAIEKLDPLVVDALKTSIERVRRYHEKQLQAGGGNEAWSFEDEEGNKLGQRISAMEKVGLYAPGGKACYPSTIIMTAIPAKVAGVDEVFLVTPTPGGEVSDILLATAHLCGVSRMFRIGGAQAIGALAYGTATVPRVDKIVGPGNIYVATAKELVFGAVGIDMIAGPSEVVIVADSHADVDWLVMDMFAQAEHDEMAQAILISSDAELLERVGQRIPEVLATMERKDIIEQALNDRGALVHVENLSQAADLVNQIAPEHLELALSDAEEFSQQVRHAGAIFIGGSTAEVVGDYTAGPSHVLPTNGTARFASPLGVYDFQVRSSVIQCSPRGAVHLSRAAAILATEEGLEAHSKSAQFRVQG